MEGQDAYNLHHKKEKFVKLLEENGFRYYERDHGAIRSSSDVFKVFTIGKILHSNPPYLIIFNQTKDTMHKERSRLRNLAESFPV